MAHFPMMVTYQPGEGERFSLTNGMTVPAGTARFLIRRGWVIPEKDGLFDRPQSYHVKTP